MMKVSALPAVAMEQYVKGTSRSRKTETVSQASDRVEISGAQRLFSEALEAAKAAPEVRADRVGSVRSLLDADAYRADASAIAAKILSGIAGV